MEVLHINVNHTIQLISIRIQEIPPSSAVSEVGLDGEFPLMLSSASEITSTGSFCTNSK